MSIFLFSRTRNIYFFAMGYGIINRVRIKDLKEKNGEKNEDYPHGGFTS
jgi:hypothetical protein